MIAIGDVLLSDEIVEEQFVCDLNSCKGGCCIDGDCGAPLTDEEVQEIPKAYDKVKKYLRKEYIQEIEQQGFHVMDDEYGYVTPTINGGICVYAYIEENGIVKCGFEKAWQEGEIEFQKPISCHLYPIRIKRSSAGYDMVNYKPRKKLCKPACKLGKQLQVPVYQFLKGAIIRKYGDDFYDALDATAQQMKK